MNYRNAKYRGDAIDMEIEHPDYGWIPFTARADDIEQFGRDQYALAIEGSVAPAEPEPEPDPHPPLSPRQFTYLLASTGLDDVWNAVEQQTKGSNRPFYAKLRAQREASAFRFDLTMAFVSNPQVRQVAAAVAPDADLSEATIAAAWDTALAVDLDTL